MAVALGGRVAEELIFGEDDVTTGASGDFMQVSHQASRSLCLFPRVFVQSSSERMHERHISTGRFRHAYLST